MIIFALMQGLAIGLFIGWDYNRRRLRHIVNAAMPLAVLSAYIASILRNETLNKHPQHLLYSIAARAMAAVNVNQEEIGVLLVRAAIYKYPEVAPVASSSVVQNDSAPTSEQLRASGANTNAPTWDDPAVPVAVVPAPTVSGSILERLDQLECEREKVERLKPPTSAELCQATYKYVAYDDDATLEQIDDLIDRGAPVSAYHSKTLCSTPLKLAVSAWSEACGNVIRGSNDKRKLIVVLDRLIAARADPRIIDENGDTPRAYLERQAQGRYIRHWDTNWTEIANEGIALLLEAERAADRRDLESAAQGGASERTGITRRM